MKLKLDHFASGQEEFSNTVRTRIIGLDAKASEIPSLG